MRVLFDAIEQSFEQSNIYGVIEDLYAGAGGDFLKCHECDYSSDRPNKFYDLQLAVKNEFDPQQDGYNDSIEKALFKYLCPRALHIQNVVSSRFAVGMPQEAKLKMGVLDAILDASPKTPQGWNTESL